MARPVAKHASTNAAKTEIMAYLKLVLETGFARQAELGNGDIELTLLSGEVFHLSETSITRIG
jgi:hypothetical protein